jgi:hypothetical protein
LAKAHNGKLDSLLLIYILQFGIIYCDWSPFDPKELNRLMSTKHLDAVLVFCLLFAWICSEFSADPVEAEPLSRVAGVKVGDVTKYGNFLSLWASESPSALPPQTLYEVNNTLSLVNTVLDVSNNTVSFESRIIYRNGTERVEMGSVDVVYGNSLDNLIFVAAELGAGDRVSFAEGFSSYRINSTGLRDYCGVMRETNVLNVTQVYTYTAYRTKLYWDKATGLLMEQRSYYTELTETDILSVSLISYSMVDNNVWVGVSDFVMPVAKAGSDRIVDVGTTVVFDAGGSSDNVGIAKVLWDFGDGESAVGLSVSHVYDSAGVFNVTLTVEDGAGNRDLDCVLVAVREQGNPILMPGLVFLVVVSVVLTGWLLVRRFSNKRRVREQGRRRR